MGESGKFAKELSSKNTGRFKDMSSNAKTEHETFNIVKKNCNDMQKNMNKKNPDHLTKH